MRKQKKKPGSVKAPGFNPAISNLIAGGDENFLRYLNGLGMAREHNLMVLSSRHHYYYDETELRSVRTILNLEKLNLIKHIDRFLSTLFRILPPDASFIGCFDDSNKKIRRAGWFSCIRSPAFLRRFRSIPGSKPEHFMDKEKVSDLFATHGFRIVDMKEMNGLIYFHSQNVSKKTEAISTKSIMCASIIPLKS